MTSHDRLLDVDLEVLAATEPCEYCDGFGFTPHPVDGIGTYPCPWCDAYPGMGRVPSKLWRPWKPTTCPTCGDTEDPGQVICPETTCLTLTRCLNCSAGLVVPQVGDVINSTVEATIDERLQRFRNTVGVSGYMTTKGPTGANHHPDRCTCQGDDTTPHKHYIDTDLPDHPCARCMCSAYSPAIPRSRTVARSTVHQTAPIVGPGVRERWPRPCHFVRHNNDDLSRWDLGDDQLWSATNATALLDGPWAELWVPGHVAIELSTEVLDD